MTQPLLTIGMAHFDDFSGLWPTILSIRLNNADLMPQTEFVVVNNNPEDTKTADAIKGLLNSLPDCHSSKYIEMPGNKGTSLSRDAIFKHATGKYTAAMDCHLEFWPGSFKALMDHYATDPESNDIISGPLLYDSLRNISTHFNDQWDDGMWGKWGLAWKCGCGPDGTEFSFTENRLDKDNIVTFPRLLKLGEHRVKKCEACGKSIPSVPWYGHEKRYTDIGFFPLGFNDGPAFEIPGQGLGFFSCRTAAWPGFNQHALGFGGEELYIQEKFRQRGGRALCIPGMKWVHRFYRTGGAKYPNTNYWKARNYVLEFQELGLPLDPIKKHFVDEPLASLLPDRKTLISSLAWDALMANAINNKTDPTDGIIAARNAMQSAENLLPQFKTIDQLFNEVAATNRDLNQHMATMRELAKGADTVLEFTGRKESTVAFLAAKPKTVVSYSTELNEHVFKSANFVADTTKLVPVAYEMGSVPGKIPENELCFIDTFHRYDQLKKELTAYAPSCLRYIIMHDTESYGARGDDGGLGLNQAIVEFCEANPEWAIVQHHKHQYGLTVLSRRKEDRPAAAIEGPVIPHGPGTELKKILASLGIHPAPNCGCNAKATQMDTWGVEECKARRETIVQWLKDGTWSGLDMAGAIARSFFTGIAWHINPLDQFGSLIDLCISRAAAEEKKRTESAK